MVTTKKRMFVIVVGILFIMALLSGVSYYSGAQDEISLIATSKVAQEIRRDNIEINNTEIKNNVTQNISK
jgi:hypothetical protein